MRQFLGNFTSNLKDVLIFLLLIFLGVTISISARFSRSFIEGVMLWFTAILPALFPYLFLTAILTSLKSTSKITRVFSKPFTKFFNVGGALSYAFFISIISGYPMGAKITCDLYENGVINKHEAMRGFCFCSTSSPRLYRPRLSMGCKTRFFTLHIYPLICSFANYPRLFAFHEIRHKV